MTPRSVIFGLSLCLTTAILPAVASAAPGFARSSASLRAGPGAEYPRIEQVSRGESLEVYGCVNGYTWCDVGTGSDRGWFPGARIEFLRDGRRMRLVDNFALFGLSVMTFGRDDYWDSHYRNRPWVNDKRWRTPSKDWQNQGLRGPGYKDPNGHVMPQRPPQDPAVAPHGDDSVMPGKPRPPKFWPGKQDQSNAPNMPQNNRPMKSPPPGKLAQPGEPQKAPGLPPPLIKGGDQSGSQKNGPPTGKPTCRPPEPC